MALVELKILESKFYRMTPDERIAALKATAEAAMERDSQPYQPREPEGDTFPEWSKNILKEITKEFGATAKYDRVNNTWKIAIPDLSEDEFCAAWKVHVSKVLASDEAAQKWYNDSPIQLTSLVDVTEPTLATDQDLQELSEIK